MANRENRKRRFKVHAIFTGLFIVLHCNASLSGQYAVSVENEKVEVGKEVIFKLFFIGSSNKGSTTFPAKVSCDLVLENSDSITVMAESLEAGGKAITTDSSNVVQNSYSFKLPHGSEGDVIIHLAEIDAPKFVIEGVKAEPSSNISLTDPGTSYTNLEALFSLYQPYVKNISAYEPMYFLVGTDPEYSKFQISFKYRLLNTGSSLAEKYSWVKGFHFGYTQTSFWDLSSDSAPFADTSYRPELFWLSDNLISQDYGLLKGVFLQTGAQHHSNGRGGEFSRSTNYLYVRPTFIFYDQSTKFGLGITPKLWGYVGNDETTNPDLMDYQGYFEIDAKAGFAESFVFGTKFRWASEGASFEFDVSYPLHRLINNSLDLYFYAQYSNMLAESLLNYNERTQAFRVGLSIVR